MLDHDPETTRLQALLMADTDATQSYVFESNRLSEIRGASTLLDQLNRHGLVTILKAHQGHLICAGGGFLLATLPAHQANDCTAAMETYYIQETGAATITAVARPWPTELDTTKEFGRFVTHTAQALRARKESKAPPPFIPSLPYQSRCQSCQIRPADLQLSTQQLNESDYTICAVCYTKHIHGNEEDRAEWFGRFRQYVTDLEDQQHEHKEIWEQMESQTKIPYSISEIASTSHSSEKLIGLVHLDGDSIGRLLAGIDSDQLYKQFSKTLADVAEAAVFATLAKKLAPEIAEPSELRLPTKKEKLIIYPFEILAIGGDDIWLIVPAEHALDIATTIAARFESDMSQWVADHFPQAETITMSGGVVLADDHTPIRLMANIAKELIGRAKKIGGAIDFQVMHSPEALYLTIRETRQAYPYTLPDDRGHKKLSLLNRPYTHDKLATLLNGIQWLRHNNQATSQLHLLSKALLKGRREATLFYRYQANRDKMKSDYQQLTEVLNEQQGAASKDPLPWCKLEGDPIYSYNTTIFDIMELLPFVSDRPTATNKNVSQSKETS